MLRFHWRLPQGGERPNASRAHQASLADAGRPDLDVQVPFARAAEQYGIDSLLIDFGWSKPDPILLAAALGMATTKMRFIIAHRSGLTCPTSFVQQMNTLATLIGGRYSLNIVAGHSPAEQRGYGDTLPHDERYERTDEFLAVCHAYWADSRDVSFQGKYYAVEHGRLNTPFMSGDGASCPEIYIAGNSPAAQRLAVSRGSCWMRLPDLPEKVAVDAAPVLASGREVGLRFAIVSRPTRAEAIDAAHALASSAGTEFDDKGRESEFVKRSDSHSMKAVHEMANEEWLSRCLWTGAVRSHGAAAIALVGAPDEIAAAILEYGRAGVSQFILSGWPKLEEMRFFASHVLPLVREGERQLFAPAAATAEWHA
jgi:alkanesulfonate monooxygenase